jgi:polysaccharide export outer membrane protein
LLFFSSVPGKKCRSGEKRPSINSHLRKKFMLEQHFTHNTSREKCFRPRRFRPLLAAAGLLAAVFSSSPLQAQKDAAGAAAPPVTRLAATVSIPDRAAGIRPGANNSPSQETLRDYRIGAGDVLQINVWKEPQASVQAVVVRSDGKISLPLIKEVHALGLRPAELERVLSEKYSQFIEAPDVSVTVTEVRSEKVYVIGGVKKPGSINLYAPMTVLQVLAEAGGLTEYAKKKNIYVIRPHGEGELRLPFNYKAQLQGKAVSNIMVRAGDTVVVPQ